jgi:hypothetical protein
MAHGFASVKEMYLDKYAEMFAQSGSPHWSTTTAASAPATAGHGRKSIP